MHLPALISDLALMLLIAGVIILLFKKLKQPLVLGYIITGFIVGPYFNLFPAVTDTVSINTWSEIGIIILMFSLGLEFNLHKLASVGGTAIITAITEVVFMLLVGFGCGKLLGWGTMDSVLLGGMLSMSSTTIIIKAFDDLKLKGNKFTELVFGTLIIEDIAGIFMMVMLSTIAVSQGVSGGELVGSLIKMVFYLALWLILGIYLLPTILKRANRLMDDETLLIFSLGICFGMVILSIHLGFSSALGAFLAGSLLAGTIHAEKIEHISKPIKDLFGAVFFISVGMMVNPSTIVQYAGPIVLLTIATIVGKSIFSSLGVLFSGQPLKTAVPCGLSLAQIGEFSFIIASLGISLGLIDDFIYPIVVSVSIITTFTTPFVIRSADGVYGFLSRHLPQRLSNYLERHTSENQIEAEKGSEWIAFLKKHFSQLAIYTVIMLGVIFAGTSVLWPFLSSYMAELPASIITSLITLSFMAPFIRQCLFRKNEYFIPLWFNNNANRLPLTVLNILRLAVVIFLIILPLQIMFSFSVAYILIAAVLLIFLIAHSDWLVAPYLKIEVRFLCNFNERKLKKRAESEPNHSWLDEQIYVTKIELVHESNVLNKPLYELFGTRHFSLRAIKIIRDHKHINIPEANEELRLGDIVFVAGKLIDLSNLDIVTKSNLTKKEGVEFPTLHDFIMHEGQYDEVNQLLCYAVVVEKGTGLPGTRIKDAKIKNKWGGLLIGLEREHYPIIFPDINMRLEENDLLWILGSQRTAGRLDDLL